MPASAADPVSSVLKNAFASSANRSEISNIHQPATGLIRGGSSSSVLSTNDSLNHEPVPFGMSVKGKQPNSNTSYSSTSSLNSNSSLENGIRANAKKLLLSSQQCNVEFDEPTRYAGGLTNEKSLSNLAAASSNSKSRIIVLNPNQKQLHINGNGKQTKKVETNGKAEPVSTPKPKVTFYSLTSVEVGYKTIRKAGAGMFNVGNTCYLNSTLQALFHTPALYNYLIGGAHTSKCTGSLNGNGFLQNCTICALTITLRDTLRNNVIKPNRVYEKLKHICKHMVHGRQEDAHEFLRYLIEACQRSFLISAQAPKGIDNASKETTPFNQIFGGYMRQDVTCLKCKHVSTTFQHFMDLLLDIRQASNIEEALSQYFRQERIGGSAGDNQSNMYKCEKCKIKVQAKKRYLIERPPAVLCIQLKRFSLLGGKISKPVQLHRKINIAPYIQPNNRTYNGGSVSRENMSSPQGAHSVGCEYNLVAMITHVGPSPNCGHYTAIGEAANGQFFQFDDSSVRPISVGQALNTASYVVFYEMTKASWRNSTNIASRITGENNSTNMTNGSIASPKIKVPSTITSQTAQASNISPSVVKQTANGCHKSNGSNTNTENRPRIITLGSSIKPAVNKLGIVSGVAKNVTGALASIAQNASSIVRTVTNAASGVNGTPSSTTKNTVGKGGLVPYDDEDSSDSENTATGTSELDGKTFKSNNINTKSLLTSPFIPRSVTVNALKAKPTNVQSTKLESIKDTKAPPTASQTNVIQSPNVERKPSSSGLWTVTDADTHNPSVNSDNSTGSTSGNWTVKDVDTSKLNKALEEGGEPVAVKHSKSSSPWNVKSALAPTSVLKSNFKLVESISSQHKINASPNKKGSVNGNGKSHSHVGDTKTGQRITSPSPSSSSSISSNSSMQCQQAQGSSISFCGSNSDVDIKSVLGLGSDTPRKRCNGGTADEGDTDYDAELDRGRTKKIKKTDSGNGMSQYPSSNASSSNPFQLAQNNHYKNKSDVSHNKATNGSKSPWQPPRNKSWSSHRDHNYQRQGQAVEGNGRSAHRNEARRNSFGANDYKDKKYRSNGTYNNDSYRGYSNNSQNYNNRDYEYNNHRDYRDNRSYLNKR